MEKDKKYNIVLGLMIFFFILVVGISLAWGLSSIGKKSNESEVEKQNSGVVNENKTIEDEKGQNNSNNENVKQEDVKDTSSNKNEENKVVLSDAKMISLTDAKKSEINDKLQSIPLQLIIMSKSGENGFNNGGFTDQEMVYLITCWDFSGDGKLDDVRKDISEDYPKYEYDYEYIKDQIKKVFDKELNINNTTYEMVNDKIIAGTPTGFGAELYKVKEVVLNEKTNVYTLTFDNLDYGDGGLEEPSILDYSSSDIIATYKIQYKKNGNNYLLIGMEKI